MFNWNLLATPLRSSDPAAVALVVNLGKLGAMGGSSGGLLGWTAEVSIPLLDFTGLGSVFCGGAIGRGGNKMCVTTDCAVFLYISVKVMLDRREHPMDREFVFIQSTTKKPWTRWQYLSSQMCPRQDWDQD
jgi:ribosomal protein L24E